MDVADTLSQNTNEEDFPERFDDDSMSDRSTSKKSGRGVSQVEEQVVEE